MYWSKLKTYTRVIGRFIRIYLDLKTYGSSRQYTEKPPEVIEKMILNTKWVFVPKGRFKMIWNLLVVILLLYTATIMPYRVCFNLLQSSEWIIFDFCVDLFFLLDIVVNFNTAIISISEKLNFSRKAIAIHYIKTWFLIDFISCFPFDFILGQNKGLPYNKLIRIIRVSRLYRLLKIIKLLKLIRFVRSQYIETIITESKFKSTTSRIIGFLLALALIVHISGCIWYYIGKIDEESTENWIFRHHIDDLSDYDTYVSSIYFVFTTLTTVGYGDITPMTNTEKCFTMILMGFGVGYYSYVIGSLSSSIKNSDQAALAIKSKYQGFKEFSKLIELHPNIVSRVKHFIKLNLYKTYTENIHIELILKDLPSNLREDLMTYLNSDIVGKFDYFKEKPKNFVNGLISQMILYSYSYMEILYEENDFPEEVYFIKSGRIFLKIQESLIFRTFNEGSYFGEIEIFEDTHRDSTAVIGSSSADLYTLNKTHFLDILKEYEEVYETTVRVSKIRKAKNDHCISEMLDELYPETDSLKTDSDQSSEVEKSDSSNDFYLKRHDTGTMISLQNDTPFKQKNRELWKNAIGGQPLLFGRSFKAKTSLGNNKPRPKQYKKHFLNKMKSLTDPVKVKRSIVLKPQFYGHSGHNTLITEEEEADESFILEEGLEEIQENKRFGKGCENVLHGVETWQEKIEDRVFFI
jgi:hypothetical protein